MDVGHAFVVFAIAKDKGEAMVMVRRVKRARKEDLGCMLLM